MTQQFKTFTASDESAGTVYWQLSGTDSADFAITDAGALSFVMHRITTAYTSE